MNTAMSRAAARGDDACCGVLLCLLSVWYGCVAVLGWVQRCFCCVGTSLFRCLAVVISASDIDCCFCWFPSGAGLARSCVTNAAAGKQQHGLHRHSSKPLVQERTFEGDMLSVQAVSSGLGNEAPRPTCLTSQPGLSDCGAPKSMDNALAMMQPKTASQPRRTRPIPRDRCMGMHCNAL